MGRHSYSGNDTKGRRRASASDISLETTRPVRARSAGADLDATVVKRQRHRLRRALLIVAAVLAAFVAAGAAWGVLFIDAVNDRLVHSDPKVLEALTPESAAASAKSSPAPQPFTMLLLGTDNRGQAGDARTDSILFARIDPEKKRVWLLSLPRDTRAEIPGHGVAKLNKAYTLGGAALTIDTVEQLLGVPVNHYMEVNINGFKRIVDVLGGVWVDVDVEIDDPKAAAANPGREGQHIEKGHQKLSPAQALVYVRSRDFPDADYTRMRHQQVFFKAVAKQSMTLSNFFRIPKLVRETSKFTRTDLTVGQLVGVARRLRGVDDDDLHTATLAGEWHSPFVYTDETLKTDLLARMFNGRAFEESTTAGAVVPEDISVAVRNGSGIGGAATKAAKALGARGFEVREVGNAKRSDYDTTLVVYQGLPGDAEAVVKEIGQGEIVESAGRYAFEADVLVVVGKDWHAVEPTKAAVQ